MVGLILCRKRSTIDASVIDTDFIHMIAQKENFAEGEDVTDRYLIEMGEETETTKEVVVKLQGTLFATATYYKGKGHSKIKMNPELKKGSFQMDQDFVKMNKDLKDLLFKFHELERSTDQEQSFSSSTNLSEEE